MFKKLLKIILGLDSKSESSTKYDGLFSYAGETHAFLIGFAAGFSSESVNRPGIAVAVAATALGYKGLISLGKKISP
ncbi:MAG: hypothetical protein ABEI52_11190, partial [Halobacteriaceae archaeon]